MYNLVGTGPYSAETSCSAGNEVTSAGLEATAGLLAAYGAALRVAAPLRGDASAPSSARDDALQGILAGIERGVGAGDLTGARAAARALQTFLDALAAAERVTTQEEQKDE